MIKTRQTNSGLNNTSQNSYLVKPVEHAAKFDGNAFIEISADEFPHLTSEKEETIEFKFKTTQANGVRKPMIVNDEMLTSKIK